MATRSFNVACVIKQVRTARIMELPLNSMGNEQFARLRSREEATRDLGPTAGKRSAGEEVATCPVACPRIWPACTRCRC